ncbi:hypothetical protein JCM10213_001537 [Rhodosporidiobolus nylandii]
MLDRLPLELVDHVVRLTLPRPFSFSQYRERQDTLLALCRTSKEMRAVAQPLLFEVVELTTADEVEGFVQAVKVTKLGGRVRQVRIGNDYEVGGQRHVPVGGLETLAASCPGVVHFHLHGIELSIASLESFTHLHTLIISETRLSPLDRDFQLPTLEELSLIFTHFTPTHIIPSHYPALKALHFQHCGAFGLEPSALQQIIQHVESLSCDALDVRLAMRGAPRSVRVLQDLRPVHFTEEPGLRERVTFLRLHPTATTDSFPDLWQPGHRGMEDEYAEWAVDLQVMAELIDEGEAPSLCLLILSSSFSGQSSKLDAALSHLRDACTARGIEVVDEPPFNPHYDSLVSQEFWRRCKAVKEQEERTKEVEAGRK